MVLFGGKYSCATNYIHHGKSYHLTESSKPRSKHKRRMTNNPKFHITLSLLLIITISQSTMNRCIVAVSQNRLISKPENEAKYKNIPEHFFIHS